MNQLTRVQVYLDPDNLAIIDDFAKDIKITRSQIIRDSLEAIASRYIKTKQLISPKKKEKNALLQMSGIAVSKTGTVGLNIDEIYLTD